jgi:uncharacterized protein YndB with AHSA1/START domain
MQSSARVKTFEATATTSAPPAAVWALLADQSAWARWGTWSEATVEGGGELRPGVVRELYARPFRVRERITAMEPDRRMAYDMVDGMRIHDYSSEITLEQGDGAGTLVRWRSQYGKANPVHAMIVRLAIRDACRRVAKAAAA